MSTSAVRVAAALEPPASSPNRGRRAASALPARAPFPSPHPERPPVPRHLRAVAAPTHDPAHLADATCTDIPPPPEALIQKLALYAFEALEGTRAVAQLGGWVTPEVVQQLLERRAARTERRTICRDERRIVPTPGRAHIGRPLPHVVEATVVLFAEPRTCAVALRFEHAGSRWRATVLTVL